MSAESYRVTTCAHGFPAASCPLCASEPEASDADDPGFALADGWEPWLCRSPEYRLYLAEPPIWWMKKDRDRWHRAIKQMGGTT